MSWALPDWRDIPAAFGRGPGAPHPTVATTIDRRGGAAYYVNPWTAAPAETFFTYGLFLATVAIAFSVAFAVSSFSVSRKWQDEDALGSLRKGLSQLSETVESNFRKPSGSTIDQSAIEDARKHFQQRLDALEESGRRRGQDQDDIDSVRKTFQQRIDALEESIRRRSQEQDAGESARRALARRLEDLEGLVTAKAGDHEAARTVADSRLQSLESSYQMINNRQLDYDVMNIKQQKLVQRVDTLDGNVRDLERQTALLATAIGNGITYVQNLDRRMYTFSTKNKLRAIQRVHKRRLKALEWRVEAARRAYNKRLDEVCANSVGSGADAKQDDDKSDKSAGEMANGHHHDHHHKHHNSEDILSSGNSPTTPSLSRRPTWKGHRKSYSLAAGDVMSSSSHNQHQHQHNLVSSPTPYSASNGKQQQPPRGKEGGVPPKWTNYYKGS